MTPLEALLISLGGGYVGAIIGLALSTWLREREVREDIDYECPICYEKNKKMWLITLPDCNHRFCRTCVDRIVSSGRCKYGRFVCPLCRHQYRFTTNPLFISLENENQNKVDQQ